MTTETTTYNTDPKTAEGLHNVVVAAIDTNPLTTAVLDSIIDHAADYNAENIGAGAMAYINDVKRGGCSSGIVNELIYYSDTVAFYEQYAEDINALASELLRDMGCNIAQLFGGKWDTADPLALETANQNTLAWFGYEETLSWLEYPINDANEEAE